jgi:mannose-6-phosphate isomerase-like protein (cupin superfamily)
MALPTWPYADRPGGSFEGEPYGSQVSFFVVDMAPGSGPRLHSHPYSETFLVQSGRARFELAGESVEAGTGDVVVAPPETAHKFEAIGTDRLRMVTIHAAARMETTSLEP